jgi:glycosyltransferase involved in cell wall biosynthesis
MFLVSLIVPTYNEAKNLPLLLQEIFSVINQKEINLEIIIVDDNSPDGTGQVAEDLKKLTQNIITENPDIFVITQNPNETIVSLGEKSISHSVKNINLLRQTYAAIA